MFACERFHQLIYGQAVIVENDYKPLVNVFHKSLIDCPMRIKAYDRTLGKFMHTLSTVQVYVNMATSNMPVSSDRMDQIQDGKECETSH